MRVVHHDEPEVHKLLHVETEGCVVNITIGVHDVHGRRFTAVEVVSEEPDADGAVWEVQGPGTVIVRCEGRQVLTGDARADPPTGADRHPHELSLQEQT
jgi:hypothetical protein